jgi:hypothetical protein
VVIVNTKIRMLRTKVLQVLRKSAFVTTKFADTVCAVAKGKPKRKTFQVEESAHELFRSKCEDRPVGRSMFDAGTQLVRWWARQSPVVRAATTSDVEQGLERVYAEALRKLADDLEATPHAPAPSGGVSVGLVSEGAGKVQQTGGKSVPKAPSPKPHLKAQPA